MSIKTPHKNAAFRSSAHWLMTQGGFLAHEIAAAVGLTESELSDLLQRKREATSEDCDRWIAELTLMVQRRAARCEEYLNARGIVTGWRIWPTRWAEDSHAGSGGTGGASEVASERHRPSLRERLQVAYAALRGKAPANA